MSIKPIRHIHTIIIGVVLFGLAAISIKILSNIPTTRVTVPGEPYDQWMDSSLGAAVIFATRYPESRLVYWHQDTKSSGLFGVVLACLKFDENGETYTLFAGIPKGGNVELRIDGQVVELKKLLYVPYKKKGVAPGSDDVVEYEPLSGVWVFELENEKCCRIVVEESLRMVEVIDEASGGSSGSVEKSPDDIRDHWLRGSGAKVRGIKTVDSPKTRTVILERTPPLDWTSKYVEK